MDDTSCKHDVHSQKGMNKGVAPDPMPLCAASGSGGVAPCSYLDLESAQTHDYQAAQGGCRDRPSTRTSDTDQAKNNSVTCEIESDGRKRYKNTKYLTAYVASSEEMEIEHLKKKFPRLKILQAPHYPILGSELSIYKIDRSLTFHNAKTRLKR